ncbi:hypothetical protein [Kribbia dieselivorans]|uniref:hypothetical protein n=1 Tax=Kribbia dieselivorans TaxID=331526 RepID=UPI000839241C|nr:hypothetical protein [Kribbia dieselivorans]
MAATPLTARETLDLWEQAARLPSLRRVVALAERGGTGGEELLTQPVGQAYAAALRLRVTLTSAPLEATAPCPQCGAVAEFAMDPAALLAEHDATRPRGVTLPAIRAWRVPTPDDLVAVADLPPAAARDALLRRCVSLADPPGDHDDPARLPETSVADLEAAMMAADPLAEVRVDLVCPSCSAAFTCVADLGEFVWTEIETRARRLLHEVDVLARAYGWTEPDVLALSDPRRAAYLGLALDGAP